MVVVVEVQHSLPLPAGRALECHTDELYLENIGNFVRRTGGEKYVLPRNTVTTGKSGGPLVVELYKCNGP